MMISGRYADAISCNKSHNNTLGTLTATISGEGLLSLQGTGYNSSNTAATPTSLDFEQDGSAGATYIPGRIVFKTGTNAASRAERMRIDNAGSALIGYTVSSSSAWKLQTYISAAAGGNQQVSLYLHHRTVCQQ